MGRLSEWLKVKGLLFHRPDDLQDCSQGATLENGNEETSTREWMVWK